MDKLTLEHLAPYLPYGLEFTDMSKDVFGNTKTLLLRSTSIDPLLHPQCGNKPILRPLSDLTKEIEHNGERFVPVVNLGWNSYGHILKSGTCINISYEYMVKLLKWHFDVFGLIDASLGVDMNTLEGGKR